MAAECKDLDLLVDLGVGQRHLLHPLAEVLLQEILPRRLARLLIQELLLHQSQHQQKVILLMW